jgi:hypothetical protein
MKKEKVVSPPEAWSPPRWELADVAAVQALAAGTASEDQQKRALKWIVERAAGTYDLEYRTDPRDHAFVSGKRNVGLNIITMLQFDIAKLKQAIDGKRG